MIFTSESQIEAAFQRDVQKARELYEKRMIKLVADRTAFVPNDKRPMNRTLSPNRAKALELRESGLTYTAIAKRLGVSAPRVREYFIRPRPIQGDLLSTRALNCIRWHVYPDQYRPDIVPADVAKTLTASTILDTLNCGRKTVWEISEWLAGHNLQLQGTEGGFISHPTSV